ncbi:hypothetical protein PCJ26_19380, partial [Klebsiella pneumoniae]|nr:hypothetical protein [Klebsiella pneumoniae]
MPGGQPAAGSPVVTRDVSPTVDGYPGGMGVDMRGLNQSGFCSYDPGFANTAGC